MAVEKALGVPGADTNVVSSSGLLCGLYMLASLSRLRLFEEASRLCLRAPLLFVSWSNTASMHFALSILPPNLF